MRKAIVGFAAIMLLSGVAGATTHYAFHCMGAGNMALESPVIYDGAIDGGPLAPGTWTITVSDVGWPPVTNPAARWNYIFNTYYIYDDFFPAWIGTFIDCPIYLSHTGIGTMQGVCTMTFQMMDWDADGILDPEECSDGLSGAVIIIHEGTGFYAELCGDGSYSGDFTRACGVPPENPSYLLDNVQFDMDLDLEECGMGTDATTWGAVKALFR